VWIYDLSGTSPMRRLTFGSNNRFPVWSADVHTSRFSPIAPGAGPHTVRLRFVLTAP
jgi:Tol biopolymer transport system component